MESAHLLRGVAEHLTISPIEIMHLPVHINDDDPIPDLLEQDTPPGRILRSSVRPLTQRLAKVYLRISGAERPAA
jgi:hypothetical protein